MKKYLITLSLIFLFFVNVNFVLAADTVSSCKGAILQVSLPGMPAGTCLTLPNYIKGLYDTFLGIIGILAAVIMMWGGFKWVVAAGSPEKIKGAQTTMWAGISGLILALFSYMILYVVNPQLTSLKLIEPETVGRKNLASSWCSEAPVKAFRLKGGVSKDFSKITTECGKIYVYQVQDPGTKKTQLLECIGDACSDIKQVCAPGSEKNPLAPGVYTCTAPQKRCEQFTTDLHARENFIRKQCPSFDVVGKGLCEWAEDSKSEVLKNITGYEDRCNWRPKLNCPGGTTRVGCAKCNKIQCPAKTVLPNTSKFLVAYSFTGICKDDEFSDVYVYDQAASKTVSSFPFNKVTYYIKGICCEPQSMGSLQCITK